MAKPYSMDLRERAMRRVAAGESARSVAAVLKVSASSVIKWAQRQRRTGSFAPGKMGGHRSLRLSGEHRTWLLARVAGDLNVTLRSLARELDERGITICHGTVGRFLHHEDQSFKKTVFPAEQLRLKLARHRARWKAHQGKVDQSRLVFIDEAWIKTNMTPLRGWGSRRKRLIAHVPHGHWKTMTFLAALRHDRIDAPWVLDGPINGEAFKTYVRNELLKTLKPGDIVVLDNLGSHKGKAVRNMIRNAGAHLMFLPPYSPDLNPIEQVFAKIKHLMRRAMERTVETAQDRLVSVLDTIPPSECANYFSGAGYAAT